MSETKKGTASKAKPKARTSRPARKSPTARDADRAIEEVREIRRENEDRAASHERVVVQRSIAGLKGTLDVTTADGLTYINDVVLDQDGLIDARHALDAAFQAVS